MVKNAGRAFLAIGSDAYSFQEFDPIALAATIILLSFPGNCLYMPHVVDVLRLLRHETDPRYIQVAKTSGITFGLLMVNCFKFLALVGSLVLLIPAILIRKSFFQFLSAYLWGNLSLATLVVKPSDPWLIRMVYCLKK